MDTLLRSMSILGLIASTQAFCLNSTDLEIKELERRVSNLEHQKNANGVINPSGRPQVRHGADLCITGDLLIWQSHVNGLGYGVKSASSSNLSTSQTKEMHFNWDPGFRVGLGYNLPHDGWDLHAYYTNFYNKATGTTNSFNQSYLYPVANDPYFYVYSNPSSIQGKWQLNLNMIDLEMGREFFVSKWLILRPFLGLRNAWIHQRFFSNTNHLYLSSNNNFYDYHFEAKSKYWGIGLRPGLDTQWGLGKGFSVYGNSAFSILYGFFQMQQKQYNEAANLDYIEYMNNYHSMRIARAIAETELGLRWETMFAKDQCHFSIQVAWENMIFFGQNDFDRFVSSSQPGVYVANQGDLTIQGYSLGLRLDF
ncbi:MAG: hypothetical protein EBZ47_04235 [Chlamydiae bacterium]|nr:hypothetical protein [Chlamydiota bacterium]